MSFNIIFERYLWFQNETKQNKHLNAKALAERFEITGKTTRRNIRFMRDRLHAPLRYVSFGTMPIEAYPPAALKNELKKERD